MLRRTFFVVAAVMLGGAPFAATAASGAEVAPAPSVGTALAAPVLTATATPDTGLVDGQTVHVVADGFDPGQLLEIFECAGDSVDEQRCDPRVGFGEFGADGAGHFEFDFPVDARIYLGPDETSAVEYDCRTEPAGCRIGVGYMLDHPLSAFAPIAFDATAPLHPPVAATVTPSTGLTDGQTVSVAGANLTDFEGTWVFQCRTGDGPSACDHDRAVQLKAEPDGTIATDYVVRAAFRSPLGDDADCRAAPGACSIVVSWGFAFVADRIAEIPITFAALPPPTTTPATTPVTTAATDQLPRTGVAAGVAWLAVALLALGGILLAVGRDRVTRDRS
ncbi:MAG TPA: neocarzinostatin apoprotein domain-containing protein [Acidimicrobiia bacterium]|nr:neocarzinostatin apoprotein domain-containing protein [Acidimicrobiia bacterium]